MMHPSERCDMDRSKNGTAVRTGTSFTEQQRSDDQTLSPERKPNPVTAPAHTCLGAAAAVALAEAAVAVGVAVGEAGLRAGARGSACRARQRKNTISSTLVNLPMSRTTRSLLLSLTLQWTMVIVEDVVAVEGVGVGVGVVVAVVIMTTNDIIVL